MRYCSSFLISDVLARAPLAMDSSWMLEATYRLEASGGDLLIPARSPARILLPPGMQCSEGSGTIVLRRGTCMRRYLASAKRSWYCA